jgi:hypothetical protein
MRQARDPFWVRHSPYEPDKTTIVGRKVTAERYHRSASRLKSLLQNSGGFEARTGGAHAEKFRLRWFGVTC